MRPALYVSVSAGGLHDTSVQSAPLFHALHPSYDLLHKCTCKQVPLGRKFRSLKIWLTMRALGRDKVKGLIRSHTGLAKDFEAMVKTDER